ncbi:MAG: riboflavin synthase [Acidobacteriota bacterium]|nr:riboflavin synthase [Acidobacteriota bacterium]
MFTGLVECLGSVVQIDSQSGVTRLSVKARLRGEPLVLGESVAVDGVCLTVAELREDGMAFDVIQETLDCTDLGSRTVGDDVHLERALRVGDRVGGHWVQGHVDGVGTVLDLTRVGGDVRLDIELPDSIARYVAYKGSIAIDGVSLTIAEVSADRFVVALIPETLRVTKLGRYGPGSRVHLEVDLLARYLERMHRME